MAVTTDRNKTKIDESCGVDLISKDGVQLTLARANHVSAFKKNLISIGRCILDGWKMWYEGLDTTVMKKRDRILKFKKIPNINDNIYYLTAKEWVKAKFKY